MTLVFVSGIDVAELSNKRTMEIVLKMNCMTTFYNQRKKQTKRYKLLMRKRRKNATLCVDK
jgi:hypothetical protein